MALYDFLKPYTEDPLAWLAALGTGAGVYNTFSQRDIGRDYQRQVNRAQAEAIARESSWQNQVSEYLNRPLNLATALPKTVSDEITRRASGDASIQGLQPGGAYYAAIGEKLGPAQLEAALQARGQDINALVGSRPSFIRNPAQPYQNPVGDMGALGKYLMFTRQQRAIEEAKQAQAGQTKDWLAFLKSRFPSAGPGGTPTYAGAGGYNPFPGVYGESSYGSDYENFAT